MNYKKRFYICLFGGMFGLHKFLEGDKKKGLLYLLTFGGVGILWIRDSIRLYPTEKRIVLWDAEEEARQNQMEINIKRDAQGIPYCPKCNSTQLQYSERRELINMKRGVLGLIVAPIYGIIGLLTGKKYKRYTNCLNCGYQIELYN